MNQHQESRFDALTMPEVRVEEVRAGCWRTVERPPAETIAKARLRSGEYAIGTATPDGRFDPEWVWDDGSDDLGDDELVGATWEDLS